MLPPSTRFLQSSKVLQTSYQRPQPDNYNYVFFSSDIYLDFRAENFRMGDIGINA